MKKYLNVILFSFLSFFLFGFKVSALDVDINFDNHDHFNFFYEMKEDTPFYRWLIGQGEGILDTLKDYYNFTHNYGTINIYYPNDITINDVDILNDYPDTKYVVFVNTGNDSNICNKLDYTLPNNSPASIRSVNICNDQKIYYLFNENAVLLYAFSGNSFVKSPLYIDNFEYILSSEMYYSDFTYWNNSSNKPSIRVKNIIIDNETYILSSDNWLSNVWHGIVSLFTGAKYMSDSGLGFEYFTKNYVITDSKGFPGLIKVLSSVDHEVSVPASYQSKSFSLTDELHLYPLGSCSIEDISLYIKANSSDKFTLYLNEVNSNDEFSYQSSYYSNYVPKVNRFIKINPLKVYSIEGNLVNLTSNDFINYVYRISRGDNFNNYTVYYNPNCYSSVYVDESLEWTNPNTGNTLTVSPEYNNWSDPENINSGNSVNTLDSNLNADNLIQKGWSGAGSFVEAANTIVSLTFSLFTEMPPEMQALLYTFFAIGLVLILLKIFL